MPADNGRHGLRRAQSCRGRPYDSIRPKFLFRLDWPIFRPAAELIRQRRNTRNLALCSDFRLLVSNPVRSYLPNCLPLAFPAMPFALCAMSSALCPLPYALSFSPSQPLTFSPSFFSPSRACAFLRYATIGMPWGHFSSHSKHSTQLSASWSFDRFE